MNDREDLLETVNTIKKRLERLVEQSDRAIAQSELARERSQERLDASKKLIGDEMPD